MLLPAAVLLPADVQLLAAAARAGAGRHLEPAARLHLPLSASS
jgi:hypothetical protein